MNTRELQQAYADKPPVTLEPSLTIGLVYNAAVKELVRRKRLVFLGMAVVFPLVLTIIWRVYGTKQISPTEFFANIGGLVYLKALVYLVSLFFGVPTIHDEVEGRTITYLFTRPLSRGAVYAGRLLAVQSISALVLTASLAVCFLLMVVGNSQAINLDFVEVYTNYFLVILLAVFCYTAIFAFMGTVFKRPLIWGILYIFAWESTVSVAPMRLQMWTLEWHLRNLIVSRQDVQASLTDFVRGLLSVEYSLPLWGSLFILLAVVTLFTFLGGLIFGRKEYVIN
ncbi:MAG TPA: ABC transporter permease [Candidatus Krumholzibacteria bacterium]|nr:ABC transporter permease [Candidatus Krumholzibacteria bacterium]